MLLNYEYSNKTTIFTTLNLSLFMLEVACTTNANLPWKIRAVLDVVVEYVIAYTLHDDNYGLVVAWRSNPRSSW